jgi:hypothetical protein
LHQHIVSIPFKHKKKIKTSIDVPTEDGGMTTKDVWVEIDIDNSEEKMKAITIREKLYKLDGILKKLVETEKIEQEITAKTMFE